MSQRFKSSSAASAVHPRIISDVMAKIGTSKIFVISKIKCRACLQAKALLNKLVFRTGISPSVLEIDDFTQQNTLLIMNYLSRKTGVSTVPQIWINGTFIGGNDDVQRMYQEGRLVALIRLRTRKRSSVNRGSVLTNYMSSTFRQSPSKANLLPKLNIETLPVNTISTMPMGNTTSHKISTDRGSISYQSSQHTKDKDRNWKKLKVLKPHTGTRVSSYSHSGSMHANFIAIEGSRNFLLSRQPTIFLPRFEKGGISKTNISSDEAILNRSSVFVQPNRFEESWIKGKSKYASVSRWV